MKSMSCSQLGGACDLIFTGETFDELAAQSQMHGREMLKAQDAMHLSAMKKMSDLINSGEIENWMSERRAEFEEL